MRQRSEAEVGAASANEVSTRYKTAHCMAKITVGGGGVGQRRGEVEAEGTRCGRLNGTRQPSV